MKVLFTTDLHGNVGYYEQLTSLAVMAEADVVINGGDMLPKADDLHTQSRFISGYLSQHFAEITAVGIRYLCCLGNDDLAAFDDLFDRTCRKYSLVSNLAQRKVTISGHEFIGMNWVVDYPFRLKDRCRMDTADYVFQKQYGTGLLSTPTGFKELRDWPAHARKLPTIEDELKALPRPERPDRSIYVIHMPPAGIGLDECRSGERVGSVAIARFLAATKPLYSLHGHIHESPQVSGRWHGAIGNTTCIQPGQDPVFTYVTLDTEMGSFKRSRAAA